MALPPSDVPASELFLKLIERPRPSEVIDFPRTDDDGRPVARIRIQVLGMDDHRRARVRAFKTLKEKAKLEPKELEGEIMREVIGDAMSCELLAMACLSVDPIKGTDKYAHIFRDGADVEKLTADELSSLFVAYLMVQRRYGPYEESIEDEEEVNAWIKRLGEGANAFPLSQLDWHQLVSLTMSLAERALYLSAALESQWSKLPKSLKSALGTLGFGRGLFTAPASTGAPTGGPSSDDADPLDRPDRDKMLTAKEAAQIAKDLHLRGDDL